MVDDVSSEMLTTPEAGEGHQDLRQDLGGGRQGHADPRHHDGDGHHHDYNHHDFVDNSVDHHHHHHNLGSSNNLVYVGSVGSTDLLLTAGSF